MTVSVSSWLCYTGTNYPFIAFHMKSQYVLPAAIVLFGLVVAGALFLVGHGTAGGGTAPGNQPVRPVDATDHIYGNPNAPVKIVEYADLECPYCKAFQQTMDQLMAYYGPSGTVAWVFRPFPLAQLHSKAPEEAQAAECAAAQGGNNAFFQYIDKVYSVTPSDNGLDLNQLPIIASEIGLDQQTFQQCLASNTYDKQIQNYYNEAISEGAQGTPHIVLMANGQVVATLEGNQPYASMRAAVDAILSSLGKSVASSTPTATPQQTTAPAGQTTLPSSGQ